MRMWQNLGMDLSEVEKNIVEDRGHTWIKVGLDNLDRFYESILLRPLNTKRVIFGRYYKDSHIPPLNTPSPFGKGV